MYQYEIAEGTTTLGARLIEKGFTVQQCEECRVHSLVPTGESWDHQCQHQLVHLTSTHAVCSRCDWRYWNADRRFSQRSVEAIFEAAHRPSPQEVVSQ